MNDQASHWKAYEKANPIRVADHLCDPHPITQRTAQRVGFTLPAAGSTAKDKRWFALDVSASNIDLALRIVDAFVKACEARGFAFHHDPRDTKGKGVSLHIDGESFSLLLCERPFQHFPLTFQANGRNWNDKPSKRLARKLNTIILQMRGLAADYTERRRRNQEEERRLEELHRTRDELRARIEEEQANLETLHREAKDWNRAQALRAYIAAVESQPVSKKQRKELAVWAAWAREQADRLDPLRASPPSILDTPRHLYRELDEYEFLNEDGSIEWY